MEEPGHHRLVQRLRIDTIGVGFRRAARLCDGINGNDGSGSGEARCHGGDDRVESESSARAFASECQPSRISSPAADVLAVHL